MTDDPPIACSLGADDFRQRLKEIATLSTESLTAHGTDGDAHVFRFRSDPETRRRLEDLVAAESECCPFLDLQLSQEGDELVLRMGG